MKPSLLSAQIKKLLDLIQTSFWFVPVLCIFTSFLAVYFCYQLDKSLWQTNNSILKTLYNISPDNASSLLSSIATSVITMTSIAFSMIVVTLTLASSQFGPRLLRTFMQDKKNQWALGSLVATFSYCLALIRLASTNQDSGFVPGIGLTLALILAVIAVFILVFLIHHVAVSIQAESVVAQCWQCLKKDIDRLFPAAQNKEQHSHHTLVWDKNLSPHPLISQHNGYIQLIDYQGLMAALEQHHAGAELDIKSGNYVIAGQCIGTLYWPDDKQEQPPKDLLNSHLVSGKNRTPIQDPEFAINQLVEIALRALSPSINDPFTAILCINRLGSALRKTAERSFPETLLFDSNNTIRIKRNVVDYQGLVKAACDQIRQNSMPHPSVVIAFIDMLTQVATNLKRVNYQHALVEQAQMIVDGACNDKLHPNDQQDIISKLQTIHAAVNSNH